MVHTALFPDYDIARKLVRFLDGKKETLFKNTNSAIWELTGTPQENVFWDDPDQWIKERLEGEDQKFAMDMWEKTEKVVNPRHVNGSIFLIKNYNLLDSKSGTFKITEEGKLFISNDDNEIVAKIDDSEGLIFILSLCANKPNGTRKDYIEEWGDYLIGNSNYRKESVISDSLRRRFGNLVKRKLVLRNGNKYELSEAGTIYLEKHTVEKVSRNEEYKIRSVINDYNKVQKKKLKEELAKMAPYNFEYLIKDLLEAMGYEEVEVTAPSNDKGVDVVGNIQNGITQVKEVIQVKRHMGNIQRPVLDMLRGSLHRFDAIKGTIVTLSDFSRGAIDASIERGAAPITLINGDKLIELLFENEVMVKKNRIEYFSIDENYASEKSDLEEDEGKKT